MSMSSSWSPTPDRPLLPNPHRGMHFGHLFSKHLLCAPSCARYWGHADDLDTFLPSKTETAVGMMELWGVEEVQESSCRR